MDLIIPRIRIIPKSERDRKHINPKARKRKYELLEDINVRTPFVCNKSFGHIRPGLKPYTIILEKGFTYDGPSGPAIDTMNFIVPSAGHDATYFLIENGVFDRPELSYRMNKLLRAVYRKMADLELLIQCKRYGMNNFRAWYVYFAVRIGGKYHINGTTPKGKS
ncbi:MAG: hypothetical protein PHQ00_05805 [Phycisphaerae bacterium]|nr:hypothetical protein [Phycisphaerae bacterium]